MFKICKEEVQPRKEQIVKVSHHKPELDASEVPSVVMYPEPELEEDERYLQGLGPAVQYSNMVGSLPIHEKP
jgi:hypothetical protein